MILYYHVYYLNDNCYLMKNSAAAKCFWMLFGLLLFFLSCTDRENKAEVIKGGLAPNFKARTWDKSSLELNTLKGRLILLDFWGSWCAPCRKEHPELVKLYEEFSNKEFKNASSFEIISIAIESDSIAWQKAIQKDNLKWPYQVMELTKDLNKVSVPVAQTFGVKQVPARFLIDEKGIIIGINPSIEAVRTYLNAK